MVQLIHPALIHFPIALLLVGIGLYASSMRWQDRLLDRMAYWSLVGGWWGSVVAVASGLVVAAVQWPYSDGTLVWINGHAIASLVLLWLAGQSVLLAKRVKSVTHSPQRRRFLLLLGLTGVLVIVTAWLGGHLVYSLHVGVTPTVP
ncbi:MAG: DUF2231 domain-containing protein [Herpetosiphon sp.]